MEVEKGIAVGDTVLLVVHGPAYAVLTHHSLSRGPFALLRLHQPVYLSVTGGTDAAGGTEIVSEPPTSERAYSRMILLLLIVPGIEGAEEEDNQAHDALGVPPLHHP